MNKLYTFSYKKFNLETAHTTSGKIEFIFNKNLRKNQFIG